MSKKRWVRLREGEYLCKGERNHYVAIRNDNAEPAILWALWLAEDDGELLGDHPLTERSTRKELMTWIDNSE